MVVADSCLWWEIACDTLIKGGLVTVMAFVLFVGSVLLLLAAVFGRRMGYLVLAVGFFGSRYERATPGERDYLRAMADAAVDLADVGPLDDVESVPTADVASVLGKKPQSLSPARDALLKKGLIYASERGRIAFTVPHFGRYLRQQA